MARHTLHPHAALSMPETTTRAIARLAIASPSPQVLCGSSKGVIGRITRRIEKIVRNGSLFWTEIYSSNLLDFPVATGLPRLGHSVLLGRELATPATAA